MNFPAKILKPTFIIKTLGCKVNQYETQLMRENLVAYEFLEKTNDQNADFYIINSCTVTHKADKETRSLIRRFHKINPRAKIVITGCYAELEKDRKTLMNIPGVAYLIRNSEKGRIADILRDCRKSLSSVIPAKAGIQSITIDSRLRGNDKYKWIPNTRLITDFKNRNRAFVKIQDGCDNKCSYCKVPLVRGPSRSRNTEDILTEVKALLKKGFKEIVLTGICLGSWGRDLSRKKNLSNLIKEISQIDSLFRIRLSSIEPIYLTDDIIDTLKDNDKVCKHFHIPLQSGDNRILRLMNRPYTVEKFAQIIGRIRKHVPDAAITTDVLVGFSGEKDRHFRRTLDFIKDIKPSRIHVFSYSKREGTAAVKRRAYPDKKRVKEMVRILLDLSRKLSMDFAGNFIGKTQNTIIENCRDPLTGFLTGYTDRYIRVFIKGADSLKNGLAPVKITRVDKGKTLVFGHLDNGNII